MSHVGYILSVAGGAIAQAFLAVDPSYAISYSTVESFTLRLYGQSKANCVTLGGSSQVAGLASLKDSPALLSSKSSDLYFQQRSNQDSLIYAVDKMARNPLLVDTSNLQKCSIKYKVLTKTFEELFSYRGDCAFLYQPPTYCGVNCIQVITPIYQYPYTWSQIDIKFTLPYEYYKSLSKIEFTHCSRCHDLYFYLNGKQIFEFHGGGGEYWFTLDIPVTNLIPPTKKTAADQIIQVKVYTKTGLGPHHTCNVYRRTSVSGPSFKFIFNEPVALCVVVDEFYDNQCTAYENDPDCVLWEETQDGIPTVMNGIKTGITPYQTCREFCNRNICSIWEIERTYKCNKRKEDSLAAARKRLESVASSIAIDRGIGIASYRDTYVVSGNWVVRDQTVRFPPQDLPDECIPVCRVKVNPSVKEMQAKVELNPTPRVVYKYLPCESIGGQYICPYNPEEGEEVVSPCNCASHFPEAITAIQAMRLAGQDMICSSGVEKTF